MDTRTWAIGLAPAHRCRLPLRDVRQWGCNDELLSPCSALSPFFCPPSPLPTLSSHPGYFGKVGQRRFHLQKNLGFCPTVNVEGLWHLAGEEALKASQSTKGKAVLLDVTQHGFFKVLGKGRLPNIPIVVKARYVSKQAEEKIKAAGGAVILTA